MLRLISSLVLVISALLALPLAAQGPSGGTPELSTWQVEVRSKGGCADDPSFASSLGAEVPEERRPRPGSSPDLRAEVRLDAPGHATVQVVDASSGRVVGSRDVPLAQADCLHAAETIGFVLAVLLQSERSAMVTPEPAPPPPPPPRPPPPPSPEPAAPRRHRTSGRYAWLGPRPRHEISGSAGVSLGLLPGLPVGGRFSWTIRPAKTWPITLWGSGWRAAATHVADSRFGAAYGGLLVCPLHHEGEWFQARGCAGAGAGAAWAQARDNSLYQNDQWRKPLALLGSEANFALRIAGPLFVELSLRADVALPRRSFYYVRGDSARRDIFRASWVMGNAFLGLGLRFR